MLFSIVRASGNNNPNPSFTYLSCENYLIEPRGVTLNVYCFSSSEKVKARLEADCKSLNISLDEWFHKSLKVSEFDVLVKFMDNPKAATEWQWDEKICQFVPILTLNKLLRR